MPIDRQLDGIARKRMRHAERKLKEAQRQLVCTERSIQYRRRIIADIKHEKNAGDSAIQPPL
jgi:hypothetical protein